MFIASFRGHQTPTLDDTGALSWTPTPGGLVNAVQPGWRADDSAIWVASGRTADARAGGSAVPRRTVVDDTGRSVALLIDRHTMHHHYNVMSNSVLWPLFHGFLRPRAVADLATDLHAAWDAYRAVNDMFAAEIACRALENDTVVVHDYQLMLVPAALRQHRPDLKITYFHHIPFTYPDSFDAVPRYITRALLASLACASVGLQSRRWQRALLACLPPTQTVHSYVRPVEPDFTALAEVAPHPRVDESRSALARLRDRYFVLARVDRLDPMKNALGGLDAVELAFELFPQLRGHLVYIQHLVPTRGDVEEYRLYRTAVEARIQAINSRWQQGDWTPIRTTLRDDYPASVALLMEFDALLVNPIREGLNLVAQEGAVMNQSNGVVLLSTHCGSYDLLGDDAVLPVDPADARQTAEAIHSAFCMSDERRRQMSARARALLVSTSPSQTWHRRLVDEAR